MMYRVLAGRPAGPHAMPVALAALAALLWLGPRTNAHATDGSACSACGADQRRARLDQILGDDPTRGRLEQRLDDKPWIGQDWATLPVAAKAAEQTLDVSTSLQHFGSFEARRTMQKIEDAKALAPNGLTLPKSPTPGPAAFDVWSRVEVKGPEGQATDTTRGTVGADYRIARGALVGVSAQMRDETPTLQQDTRLAAYFAVKPWSPVTFDAKAQWGESHAVNAMGLVTTQSAVMARLKGNFSYEGLKFGPTVSVAHGVDEAAHDAGDAIERSTLSLSPRVSRPFELRGGGRIEPFLSLKSSIAIGSGETGLDHGSYETTRGLGGGVTLVKPNAYSLSLTTDLEQTGSSDQSNVRGRMELKLPLR